MRWRHLLNEKSLWSSPDVTGVLQFSSGKIYTCFCFDGKPKWRTSYFILQTPFLFRFNSAWVPGTHDVPTQVYSMIGLVTEPLEPSTEKDLQGEFLSFKLVDKKKSETRLMLRGPLQQAQDWLERLTYVLKPRILYGFPSGTEGARMQEKVVTQLKGRLDGVAQEAMVLSDEVKASFLLKIRHAVADYRDPQTQVVMTQLHKLADKIEAINQGLLQNAASAMDEHNIANMGTDFLNGEAPQEGTTIAIAGHPSEPLGRLRASSTAPATPAPPPPGLPRLNPSMSPRPAPQASEVDVPLGEKEDDVSLGAEKTAAAKDQHKPSANARESALFAIRGALGFNKKGTRCSRSAGRWASTRKVRAVLDPRGVGLQQERYV
ncbi:hypothetical protein CYMTET_2884, partial [Cymbomonas tetramitiformis]